MEEMSKHGEVGHAAMLADMDRKTARKYIQAGKLPSETVAARTWCTREDPFAKDREEIEALLTSTPELEAKTIFAMLMEKYPGRYEPGQLRTLQRHVKRWRAEHGPDKEVVLAQLHRAGEAAQTDFTSTTELAVTIAGQLFMHLLCVVVLPVWLIAIGQSVRQTHRQPDAPCQNSVSLTSTTRRRCRPYFDNGRDLGHRHKALGWRTGSAPGRV